jgi:hypothetical protein
MAPLFPRSGPGEPGSPMSQVLLRCYDSRISGHLFASLPGSTRSSSFVSRSLRSQKVGEPSGPGSIVQPATQSAGLLARGRERDLPGSQAIHPVPLPRSTTPAEPTIPCLFDGSVDAAPALPTAKASALMNFGAQSRGFGTCCLRFKNDVATIPAKLASGRLAWPLPGGLRSLWIATKGFSSNSHPPFLDLAWRKGSFFRGAGRKLYLPLLRFAL